MTKTTTKFFCLTALFLLLGCSTDESETSEVNLPVASFTASATNIQTGTTVTFTNNSANANNYSWQFNGGNPDTSTEINPMVTYATAGNYSVVLTATNDDGSDSESRQDYILVEAPPMPNVAVYEVTFKGTWNAVDHPVDFPSGDHFSSAVGMVHKPEVSFFSQGELASQGVEDMAELGANGDLSDEIAVLVNSEMASAFINGGGLGTGSSSTTFQIEVSEEFPMVSLVSMIAPSPDWFVAVENVVLFSDGNFVENLTVNAVSYDAGTDSGLSYTSSNSNTDPQENITIISQAPLGNGTDVDPAVAQFIFQKINP